MSKHPHLISSRVTIPHLYEDEQALTFIVTNLGEVVWTYCLCRHKHLRQVKDLTFDSVAWGGVLDKKGNWTRPSFDHGDASSILERNQVIDLLRSEIQPL